MGRDVAVSDKVPIYYTVDKPGITKTTLTFDDFGRLLAAIGNKEFAAAKLLVMEQSNEQSSI